MLVLYVVGACAATFTAFTLFFRGWSEAARFLRRRGLPAVLGALAIAGCSSSSSEGTGGASVEACPSLPNTKPGAYPVCLVECAAHFADCDGIADNGCETDLDSPTNCGACGAVCDPTQTCAVGCNETVSCFPSPTNCPRCSVDTSVSAACAQFNELYPLGVSCEPGAPPVGGCVESPFGPAYECCPAAPDGGM